MKAGHEEERETRREGSSMTVGSCRLIIDELFTIVGLGNEDN